MEFFVAWLVLVFIFLAGVFLFAFNKSRSAVNGLNRAMRESMARAMTAYGLPTAMAGDCTHYYCIFDTHRVILINGEEFSYDDILKSRLLCHRQGLFSVKLQTRDLLAPFRIYDCGNDAVYANRLHSTLDIILAGKNRR